MCTNHTGSTRAAHNCSKYRPQGLACHAKGPTRPVKDQPLAPTSTLHRLPVPRVDKHRLTHWPGRKLSLFFRAHSRLCLPPDKLWKCTYHISYPLPKVTLQSVTGHWYYAVLSTTGRGLILHRLFLPRPRTIPKEGCLRVKSSGTTGYL